MLAEDVQHDLLYRCVDEHRWRDLTAACFARRFADEVSSLSESIVSTHDVDLPNYGNSTVYRLGIGYTVLVTARDKWSLFEEYTRVKANDHLHAWARFSRGAWVARTPRAPGLYFVRDRQRERQSVRELRLENGRLRDTTAREYLPPGVVSNWNGEWWEPALPALP